MLPFYYIKRDFRTKIKSLTLIWGLNADLIFSLSISIQALNKAFLFNQNSTAELECKVNLPYAYTNHIVSAIKMNVL